MAIDVQAVEAALLDLAQLQAKCTKQLLTADEARDSLSRLDHRARAALSGDTDAWRTYDRRIRERTAWWKRTSSGYVDPTDCENIQYVLAVIRDIRNSYSGSNDQEQRKAGDSQPVRARATYRVRRLERYFQIDSGGAHSVVKVGCQGVACRNITIALRYLGYDVAESDLYGESLSIAVRQFQANERHTNVDGLFGPGTRRLLVETMLQRWPDRRIFNTMTFPHGEPFPRVFVSYAHEDRKETEEIVTMLTGEGVCTWVDYRDLRPGVKWALSIEQAIPASRYFLALLSQSSISKTGYVQKEVKTAWDVADKYPDDKVYVIPVRLEPCELRHPRFAELHWLDLFPNRQVGVETLVDLLAESD